MSVSYLGLAVPEHVRADIEREQAVDRHLGAAHEIDRMIKEVHPDCSLVWVGERSDVPGVTPARWHVLREDPSGQYMDTYIEWSGPGGCYLEPSAGILKMLDRGNLWNRDVVAEARAARAASEESVRKAQEELSAKAVDTFATHTKALLNPGVTFSDARPWTNRVNKLPGK